MLSELSAFVDRYHAIRKFVERVNNGGLRNGTIAFYGDGHFGKTMLSKYLQEHCVKQIGETDLTALRAREDEDFVTALRLIQEPSRIPYASIDFDYDQEDLHDSYKGLHRLYLNLKKTYKHDFPLFAYACLNLLVSENKREEEARKEFGPSIYDRIRDLDLSLAAEVGQDSFSPKIDLKQLANFLTETVMIGSTRLREGVRSLFKPDDSQKRWMSKIATLGPEELREELPLFFALDLQSIVARKEDPKRVVLFFDSFEAPHANDRNHWLARLANELRESERTMIVLMGRKLSAWMDRSEVCYIGPLSAGDAQLMVWKAGVSDTNIAELMIDCATLEADKIDPHYLSLCIDRAKKSGRPTLERTDFQDLYGESLDQRLRFEEPDAKKAIIALSSCRYFDRDIYDLLGDRIGFSHSLEEFEDLCNRPLVVKASAGEPFRIETRLRKLVMNSWPSATREAHKALEAYYTQRVEEGEGLAVLSAIYHANRNHTKSWERSLEMWEKVFRNALKESNYELCGLLIKLTKGKEPDNLVIKDDSWRAKLLAAEAIYFAHLSENRAARRVASKARRLFMRASTARSAENYIYQGLTLMGIGELLAGRKAQTARASCYYKLAQDAFDKAHTTLPCQALIGKARALIDQAALYEASKQNQRAKEMYDAAILACKEVGDYGCDEGNGVEANVLTGQSLQGLGRLRQNERDFQTALDFDTRAMQAYEMSLTVAVDNADIYIRMASANIFAAEICEEANAHSIASARDSNIREVITFYRQALATCDSALKYAPRHVDANVKRAVAHLGLGKLLVGSHGNSGGTEQFEKAIVASGVALETAPKNVEAFTIRAQALLRLGQSRYFNNDLASAERSYVHAIAVCGEALALAPESADLYSLRAAAHLSLAELWLRLKPTQDATEYYDLSVLDYDEALRLGPDDDSLLAKREFALSRRRGDS
jgi:tetratricopeptide (TPR) repeat protein